MDDTGTAKVMGQVLRFLVVALNMTDIYLREVAKETCVCLRYKLMIPHTFIVKQAVAIRFLSKTQ